MSRPAETASVPRRSDGLADGVAFVRAEIIHDDDVARLQRRQKYLLDVGAKALAVDWAVEQARRRQAIVAQGGKERECFPATMRHLIAQPPTALGPTAQRRHVRLGPGFIDEYELRRVDGGLALTPLRASAGNIRPVLFAGEHAFFCGSAALV